MTASKSTDAAKLSKQAAAHGLTLEGSGQRWRLTDTTTGTWVAADWTKPDGYGLHLDDIATALATLGRPPAPPATTRG